MGLQIYGGSDLPRGRGRPRLEAALSLIWRWRAGLKGEVAEAAEAAVFHKG
jgi:hypothetical protein